MKQFSNRETTLILSLLAFVEASGEKELYRQLQGKALEHEANVRATLMAMDNEQFKAEFISALEDLLAGCYAEAG